MNQDEPERKKFARTAGARQKESGKDMMFLFVLPVFMLTGLVGSLTIWTHGKK
jgi:hypothetical protein